MRLLTRYRQGPCGTRSVRHLTAGAGPGIDDPETALRRGAGGGGSAGLGLDIARRMAEGAGGGVRIDRSAFVGAQIQVWPPTTPKRARRRRIS